MTPDTTKSMTPNSVPPRPTAPSPKASPAQPAGGAMQLGQARSAEALAAEVWKVRISFAQPLFGMGEYSWQFTCDGHTAEDFAQALLERRPAKLTFPDNTVVVDTAHVVFVDFQPYKA